MSFTRREMAHLMAGGVVAAMLPLSPAHAQTTHVRLPLSEFLTNQRLREALRRGVAAMKARKPSDPLSWFFQASIHGVTDHLIKEAAATDSNVLNVDRQKYWNQCPHSGQNSANFLPWHRAYTYHFEQILRMHTGENDFALPYWDYTPAGVQLDYPGQLDFPKFFGIQHLNGNTADDSPANINPLFHPDRDYFLCGYEHPYTDQLPLAQLSPRAVDTNRALASPVFFGATETEGLGGGIADDLSSTRGLLEQAPHDQIHRVVGGVLQGVDDNGNPVSAVGAMAQPPTAGFDPIFPIHHANIDRLWAKWACMPGKSWGTLPPPEWFDASPWYFFDTSGNEVNRPRRSYFDHRALDVHFKDEDPSCMPLQLPAIVHTLAAAAPPMALLARPRLSEMHALSVEVEVRAPATAPTRLRLIPPSAAPSATMRNFRAMLTSPAPAPRHARIVLHDVDVTETGANGFDVFLVPIGTPNASLTRSSPGYLGPISLFNHTAGGRMVVDQSFEATQALGAASNTTLDRLELILVPYALSTRRGTAHVPLKLNPAVLTVKNYAIEWGPSQQNSHSEH